MQHEASSSVDVSALATESAASAPRILQWQHMNGQQIARLDRANTVVMVACSPLEVHGPHLPTLTDICEAQGLGHRMAEMLCDRFANKVFVELPPVYMAADVLPHVGSIRFAPQTVVQVLYELGRSLVRQGFKDIWVSNFHGGPRHFTAIDVAAEKVNRRHGGRMVSVFGMMMGELTGGSSDLADVLGEASGLGRDLLKGDSHGGAVETSMMLHLLGQHVAPSWRDLPRATVDIMLAQTQKAPLQKGDRPTLPELFRGFVHKHRYFEGQTYSGAPAAGSLEAGKRVLDVLAGLAAQACGDLLEGKRDLAQCHSPLWPARHVLMNRPLGWLFDTLVPSQASPV